MRISDWSSDVCSSDLVEAEFGRALARDIDDQLRGVRAQCALVEEGQQRLRSGQLIGAGQRSSGQHDMLAFSLLDARQSECELRFIAEAGVARDLKKIGRAHV